MWIFDDTKKHESKIQTSGIKKYCKPDHLRDDDIKGEWRVIDANDGLGDCKWQRKDHFGRLYNFGLAKQVRKYKSASQVFEHKRREMDLGPVKVEQTVLCLWRHVKQFMLLFISVF